MRHRFNADLSVPLPGFPASLSALTLRNSTYSSFYPCAVQTGKMASAENGQQDESRTYDIGMPRLPTKHDIIILNGSSQSGRLRR